ncbi:MAG: putative Ig domain-containing protein, partial [bacterium]
MNSRLRRLLRTALAATVCFHLFLTCGGGGAAVLIAILTGSSLPKGTIGIAYPSVTLQAGGGTAPYEWILLSGDTSGLTLSSAGVISGTPQAAGVFTFHVRVTDARSRTAEKDFSLAVNGILRVTVVGQGTVVSNPSGIGCPGDCEASYFPGTIVTLSPAPVAGWRFDGWSGDADCSNGQVTVDAVKSCTATFSPIPPVQFTLTVSKS